MNNVPSDNPSFSYSPPKSESEIDSEVGSLMQQAAQLRVAGKIAEAMGKVEMAMQLLPEHPRLLDAKGLVLLDLGKYDQALSSFEQALEIMPDLHPARFHLALLQIKLGDFARGWKNYEARWLVDEANRSKILKPWKDHLPLWLGDKDGAKTGKSLIVLHEQGYGDNMHFARLLRNAARRFDQVGYFCHQNLFRLMEWSFAEQENIYVTSMQNPLSLKQQDWDCYCPIMSLPMAFGLSADNLAEEFPYLKVIPSAQRFWQRRLHNSQCKKLRVGVVWSGNPADLSNSRRSLNLSQLARFMQGFSNEITWVSLQKLPPGQPAPQFPADVQWLDWSAELSDFAETAALMVNLDLIISIDSAVSHLAGALNIPTFLFDRFDYDWSWIGPQQGSYQSCIWYPSIRILRQEKFGEWDNVYSCAQKAMSDFLQNACNQQRN